VSAVVGMDEQRMAALRSAIEAVCREDLNLGANDIITDFIVVAGVVDLVDNTSGVFLVQPDTPTYTTRGLLACAVDICAAGPYDRVDGDD